MLDIRERQRRTINRSPDNKSPESLVVITTRVALLMNEEDSYKGVDIIQDFNKIGIKNVNDLYLYLEPRKSLVRINKALSNAGGKPITMNMQCYLRSGALYMSRRYNEDHEYYQRMMERFEHLKASEAVIAGIVHDDCFRLNEVENNSWYPDDGDDSMVSYDESISSDDDSMPPLQERRYLDSSSDDEDSSFESDSVSESESEEQSRSECSSYDDSEYSQGDNDDGSDVEDEGSVSSNSTNKVIHNIDMLNQGDTNYYGRHRSW